MENIKPFSSILIAWYLLHKRNLPWRETDDAYRIWISEIILQQTRVDQGLAYYLRFMELFPDVHALAAAPESAVLKCWQGLGYYSRARNLHAAAKTIVSQFHGHFPKSYEDILQLKGIGPYTAAAVASFAFHLPYAVIDGNVIRVLSRYFNISEPVNTANGMAAVKERAEDVFDPERSHLHNQAIMEFGALQCTPSKPDCPVCPLQAGCQAHTLGLVNKLPCKTKTGKIRDRYFHYLVLRTEGGVFMQKRTEKDVWLHLFEFPLIEVAKKDDVPDIESLFKGILKGKKRPTFLYKGPWDRQILSHQRIHARFWHYRATGTIDPLPENWQLMPIDEMQYLPVPKLIERHIHDA